MYTGYYCKKCKIIPLIKLNKTDNKDIKYMVKCKCNINYLSFEEIHKKYYIKNLDPKYIINEKLINDIENDDSLLLKIKEIITKIKNNNKQLLLMKNTILNFFNEKMKEIEYLYNKTIKINENLEKLILILIKSYEYLNFNYSNIKNIKYQTNINLLDINNKYPLIDERIFNKSIQNSIDLLDEILPNAKEELEELEKKSNGFQNYVKDLKTNNNQLFLQSIDSIYIYLINDLNSYVEISLPSIIKFDIDKQNNIICLFPDCIKIFSEINYEQIKALEKENKIIDNFPKLDVKPIIIIKNKKMKYDNLIYLDDEKDKINRLICNDKACINILEYDLSTKSSDVIYSFKFELFKDEIIKYNNKALLLFNSLNISLFDLSKLKITEKLDIYFDEEYIITGTLISDEELLISQNNIIYIIKLKNLQIKLKVGYEDEITHIFQLKDKSIIICFLECAKRYSPKTFEMMSIFYSCYDCGDYDKYSEKYIYNYIYITKAIQLSDTKIVILLEDGECSLQKLTI